MKTRNVASAITAKAVMGLQGVIFGFGFDRVMHWLGIDLGKLSHDE